MKNIVCKNDKCNPSFILELANKILYQSREYKKCTNRPILYKIVGSNSVDAGKNHNQQSWSSPQIWWKNLTRML